MSITPIAQFEDKPNKGQNDDQIVEALLQRDNNKCKSFNSSQGPKHSSKGVIFRRVSTQCTQEGGLFGPATVLYEEIVAVDAMHNQLFRLGGYDGEQQLLQQQVTAIYDALLASYR